MSVSADSCAPAPIPRLPHFLISLALWVLGGALALFATAAVMKRAADMQLQADAEHVALQWAALVTHTVPGLEAVLSSGELTPQALDGLRALSRAGDVFRYKLFDREGRQLLVSDALPDASPPRTGQRVLGDEHGPRNAEVRRIVLGGSNRIELKRATRADRPAVYSEAYVPVVRQGQVLGVVEVYVDQAARERRIAAASRNVALAVAAVLLMLVAAAVWQWHLHLRRQRAAERQVRYLAHHDPLTGALNRAAFGDALAQAQSRAANGGAPFAVLCIDLDRFKEVNDSLGHAAGDQLLRGVARRLHAVVRRHDLVARLGGDEFAVLQSGIDAPDAVSGLADRIVDTLARPHDLNGQQVRGGASVGAAIYSTDTPSVDALLHQADAALYHAKLSGRGRFSFYDAASDHQRQERLSTARDLRQALREEHLHLHFQPLYDGDGRTLLGYEALVRWTHPQRGVIPPSDFIPIAEETGLIDELGGWVLARGCEEATCWPSSLSLAVNLSALQFRTGTLVATVARALEKAGLPASRLELEITESLLMSNTEQVVRELHALTGMGVRISMDDFGTGYSSLAYLWRFPFDKVKIDRAFTQNLDTDPKVSVIVRSIVSLAHSLNIRVNAEGVESPAQLRALQEHGCDELQGFLLGRPAPSGELRHMGARQAAHKVLPRAQTDFAPLDLSGLPTQPAPL